MPIINPQEIPRDKSYKRARRNLFLGLILLITMLWGCADEYSKGGRGVWAVMLIPLLVVFAATVDAHFRFIDERKKFRKNIQ